MDSKAFFRLSCGLYIISTSENGHPAGCIINTTTQVTSTPSQLMVAVNKENYTAEVIQKTKKFDVMCLTEDVPMEWIGLFGFQSSRDINKFEHLETEMDCLGIPYLKQYCNAHFACQVQQVIDVGTHLLFIGLVNDCAVLSDSPSITYDYYHKVKKGLTPPKASSYIPPSDSGITKKEEQTVKAWKCQICGYIYENPTLPTDFTCPICKKSADFFEPIYE